MVTKGVKARGILRVKYNREDKRFKATKGERSRFEIFVEHNDDWRESSS